MLIRALIVLLIALNLGAAAWWITRPAPTPPLPPSQPAGVARLQLLSENAAVGKAKAIATTTSPATPAAVAPVALASVTPPLADIAETPSVPAAAAEIEQCFSLGPFADAATAKAAGARIGTQSTRTQPREVPGRAASGYNVSLPPAATREAAQALAQRIGAAGFDDLLVVSTGAQANGIALGRYGSRDAAERRQTALVAAGFPAQLIPIGNEAASQWWLDVAAAKGVEASVLKATAAAAQSRSRDCTALR